MVAGDDADLLRAEPGDADPAAVGGVDRDALGAQQPDEVVEAVGADGVPVARRHCPQLRGRDVLDQTPAADDHVVLGHQLHLTHQVQIGRASCRARV